MIIKEPNMATNIYADSEVVRLADTAICYLRRGRGPPVTLLHGIPLSLLTWRHNIDALSTSRTVIAIDLKGFGRSGKPHGDFRAEVHAKILGDVLDTLGVRQTSLVGSSYGCAPAIYFALENPSRVDRVVLINSVGGGRPPATERLLEIDLVASLVGSVLRHPLVGQSLFGVWMRRAYGRPPASIRNIVKAYFCLFVREHGEKAFVATLRQFDELKLAQSVGKMTHKTLIVWGGRDPYLPLKNAKRLHAAIPASELKVLNDCGHLPHEESPKEVNALINSFLCGREPEFRVSL